ncbi:GAF and ANTAR domain-containing protein [Amycolatopsis jejuensis]|uniref:GAF and ANTAR domain-containing protein n=1 Tax=Amycolatopsis jejuensis TaxID=330084 RepID=UPI00068B203C|nr:GAF and ANTAR domain-containing protein [Amycolatopsis jejuensis]
MSHAPEELEPVLRDRERRVSRTFVSLADTLVADFDISDFLNTLTEQCIDLLGVSAVGVILRDPDGGLHVAATSSQRAELLELFAVQTDDGPCVDCVTSGAPVSCADLRAEAHRWPRFTAAAHECGFRSAQALPMRLREEVIGVVTLLGTEPGGADRDDVELAQALAAVATIGILQQRTIERGDRLAGQLQIALTSRVVIEQAKGMLAEHGAVSMDEAFAQLRGYARAHHQRLTDLAREVAEGTADLAAILIRR